MEEKSLAMELLQDMKKTNKRMFVLLVIILILWFARPRTRLQYSPLPPI